MPLTASHSPTHARIYVPDFLNIARALKLPVGAKSRCNVQLDLNHLEIENSLRSNSKYRETCSRVTGHEHVSLTCAE
jgi:hypothetical protein